MVDVARTPEERKAHEEREALQLRAALELERLGPMIVRVDMPLHVACAMVAAVGLALRHPELNNKAPLAANPLRGLVKSVTHMIGQVAPDVAKVLDEGNPR